MWLKQHDYPPAAGAEFSRRESGANLGRMVSVIINHENSVDRSFRLKPPSRAREAMKSFYHTFEWLFHLEATPDRGLRVVNIVHTRYAQDHITAHIRSAPDVKARS